MKNMEMKSKRAKVIFTKDLRVIYFGKEKATVINLKKFILPVLGALAFFMILGFVGKSDLEVLYGGM